MEQKHVRLIEDTLRREGFDYRKVSYIPTYSDNGFMLIKLDDYNRLAAALGYEQETLREGEALATPSTVTQTGEFKLDGLTQDSLTLTKEGSEMTLHLLKALPHIVVPNTTNVYVVSDADYAKINAGNLLKIVSVQFVVPDWHHTLRIAQELRDTINNDVDESGNMNYNFQALVIDWVESRQLNGLLLIVSGLVGIVFFTFAASFIYFRLYADLARDEEQYRMISKVGLSRRELGRTVSRQLLLMFFLPMLVAVIHSSVAFLALQQLVDFSVASHTLAIFATFLAIQVVYYWITRWRYLNHLHQKMI
ncbi:hypothetical protein [Paenibacillus sp. AR247]|uniref:hypothetical protein n=1 Tax=Paenibacillus sp. AR247 TaxID=1631599 RepID=UPI000CFA4B4C|nr:hypothetical protein [Paenibacillus sp. AR247]PQP86929.1 hypothetical protein CPT76_27950 [Paenibacillus sp. AR247]